MYLEKAMANCSDSEDLKALVGKAFPRVIKSLLFLQEWEDARNMLFEYRVDDEQVETFGTIIDQAESVWNVWSAGKELDMSVIVKDTQKKLSASVPKFKVKM